MADVGVNVSSVLSGHAIRFGDFAFATPTKVWGIGLLFVTLISCCAAVGIFLMPCLSKRTYNVVLTFFVGLGVGSLCGSAIFHLLPQAFDLVDPKPNEPASHAYLGKCWVAICGVFLFFLVDRLLKLSMEYRKVRKSRTHSMSSSTPANGTDDFKSPSPLSSVARPAKTERRLYDHVSTTTDGVASAPQMVANGSPSPPPVDDNGFKVDLSCGHGHEICKMDDGGRRRSVIATVAWMIIFGDGLHNFIDGLSIGAAFSFNILSGISVSVAVLCEEFPHELGDVAILIASGMTMRQALVYNLLSAATCYVGFIIGVLVGELNEAQFYIFALAAGCFLYISLGNMVSEMNKEMEQSMTVSIYKASVTLALHTSGILTGLLTMFLMAYYGQEISFG